MVSDYLFTEITYFHKQRLCVCDLKCEKAWGVNGRRDSVAMVQLDPENDDDIMFLADDDYSENAPEDPGTREGGHGKPFHPKRHNKWCVRECERSDLIQPGDEIKIPDFSLPVYNMANRPPGAPPRSTGKIFVPKDPG